MARSKFLEEILFSITPEEQAEFDAMIEAQRKWHKAHPDYNERYGTDKSYWLEEIRAKGFNPIGISVMLCEETIIFATKEESDLAWKEFSPEGWWYHADNWAQARHEYIRDMYKGIETDAPKVYCLDEKYAKLFA
jgi:hypothetical protein